MVAEQNIDTSSIAGTGLGGRFTKEDLVNSANATAPAKKVATEAPAIAAPQAVQTPVFGGSRKLVVKKCRECVSEQQRDL